VAVYVVGVGASGASARALVDAGVTAIAAAFVVKGQSRRFSNPAWGGATRAPFVNAAVVVDSPLPPAAVLRALFAIERAHGRLRTQKNAARTLDLDVLWSTATSAAQPTLPHPRFLQRSFAVIPAVEAMVQAGVVVPLVLRRAAAQHALAPLVALK
jgi:2-amino-4-hydroxy-6-hydroxymethyldihydropteridine diphosphokinase